MSGEERKKADEVDVEKLDSVELATNYGQMVDEPITMKPVSTLEGMDPTTGDYIRPPTQTLKASDAEKPEAKDENGTDEDPKKKRERQRKLSKQSVKELSTKELTRQLSKRIIKNINPQRRDSEDESDEEPGNCSCIFGNRIRFTIMLISTLCLSSILSNILTYNFTFICMAGDRPHNYTNMTVEEKAASGYREDLDYSSAQRSTLFMAVAVGALLAVFPMTLTLNKFGSRMVFGMLGFVSAFSTLLIPLSANIGFPAMVVMRILQGVGFSACLPVMGSITSHWSTTAQTGIFMAILSSFLQIAPIFTMPLSAELCVSEWGWPSIYYIHGVISIILFFVFIFYHRNSPTKHPLMKRPELVKVMFGKGSIYSGPNKRKSPKKVPYEAVLKDINIWAVLVAAFGNFMGTQLSLQFMPTYINKVLFLPIEQTGMASAVSPIIMFFIKLIAGQSSDRIKFISDVWKLRIYNTLSCGLMGVFFIVLALLDPVDQPSLCLIVLLTSTFILGFNSGGFYKSSQQISRQHSHFTLAIISFINCVCMLIVPLLNEIIAPENAPAGWAIVLWIHAICLIGTNFFFCIFASASPAKWTLDTWTNKKEKKTRVSVKRRNQISPSDPEANPRSIDN